MIYEDFVAAVAERAGLSVNQATALSYATLETLADRISGGEADDLAALLPDRLAEHLRKPASRELPDPFGLGEFVQRVADRADVDTPVASTGIQAVFSAMREAVKLREFEDMVAQLPKDFSEVLAPAGSSTGGRRWGH
ncbi:DUF2267 domain-containing protein [Plantactinospora sonchi]|uniref:DUF2267 domain-containing protein n=1 Tax=Plantactinospora sonchi TaxID=1544735 RepID=A0ABU7RY77_9ACTN